MPFCNIRPQVIYGQDANKQMISTGNAEADQLIQVLLSTSMLLGGVISLILDLIVPGTKEERDRSV